VVDIEAVVDVDWVRKKNRRGNGDQGRMQLWSWWTGSHHVSLWVSPGCPGRGGVSRMASHFEICLLPNVFFARPRLWVPRHRVCRSCTRGFFPVVCGPKHRVLVKHACW
jgi:hypothetical protein